MLNLVIHDHGLSIYFCILYFLSAVFRSVQYKSFTSLVRFIPEFILIDGIVNKIIFLIFFLDVFAYLL